MGAILIDTSKPFVQVGIRAKEGATPGLNGQYADEDQEVFAFIGVGCIKSGPTLLTKEGQQRGAVIPLLIAVKPYKEVEHMAATQLGMLEQVDGLAKETP